MKVVENGVNVIITTKDGQEQDPIPRSQARFRWNWAEEEVVVYDQIGVAEYTSTVQTLEDGTGVISGAAFATSQPLVRDYLAAFVGG